MIFCDVYYFSSVYVCVHKDLCVCVCVWVNVNVDCLLPWASKSQEKANELTPASRSKCKHLRGLATTDRLNKGFFFEHDWLAARVSFVVLFCVACCVLNGLCSVWCVCNGLCGVYDSMDLFVSRVGLIMRCESLDHWQPCSRSCLCRFVFVCRVAWSRAGA